MGWANAHGHGNARLYLPLLWGSYLAAVVRGEQNGEGANGRSRPAGDAGLRRQIEEARKETAMPVAMDIPR